MLEYKSMKNQVLVHLELRMVKNGISFFFMLAPETLQITADF